MPRRFFVAGPTSRGLGSLPQVALYVTSRGPCPEVSHCNRNLTMQKEHQHHIGTIAHTEEDRAVREWNAMTFRDLDAGSVVQRLELLLLITSDTPVAPTFLLLCQLTLLISSVSNQATSQIHQTFFERSTAGSCVCSKIILEQG